MLICKEVIKSEKIIGTYFSLKQLERKGYGLISSKFHDVILIFNKNLLACINMN